MKRIALTLSLVSIVALIAFTTVAQQPGGREGQGGRGGRRGGPDGPGGGFGPPPSPVVEAIDTNGDRQISPKELANAAAALKKLDRNQDGKLTEDELRPLFGRGGSEGRGRGPGGFGPPPEGGPGGFGPPRDGGPDGRGGRGPQGDRGGDVDANGVISRIMSFDKDKDGKVSTSELPERMQSIIKRGDTNDDGALDRDELAKVAADFGVGAGRGGGRPDGEGRGPRDGGGPGGFDGPPSPDRFVEHALSFDADKDGKLSKEELRKLAEQVGRRRGGEGRPDGGPRGGRGQGGDRPARPARPDAE